MSPALDAQAHEAWPAPVQDSAQRLRAAWGDRRPSVAVMLGSGWSAMAEGLSDRVDVPYGELPAFPALAIHGHEGRVRLGRLPAPVGGGAAIDVMVLMGRQHAYETGDAGAMRGAVQTVAAVGCGSLVLTNAAGSAQPHMPVGSLMLLSDHLNIVQRSPLVGASGSSRFVDMSCTYDEDLRGRAREGAASVGITLAEGVYAWVLGPQFETPAEIRMLRLLGADAVGMSTVPEAIAARHAGLPVLGISLITNMAAGLSPVALSHEQTLSGAADHESVARRALEAILHSISR